MARTLNWLITGPLVGTLPYKIREELPVNEHKPLSREAHLRVGDCTSFKVCPRLRRHNAQRATAGHEGGEMAGGNPAQRTSLPVPMQAFGLAVEYISIALAAHNYGGVGTQRERISSDIRHLEELMQAFARGRAPMACAPPSASRSTDQESNPRV